MATIPRFQELYDEGQATLEADPTYQFLDFTPGSWLDAFCAVAAAEAQAVIRWSSRRFLACFVSSAEKSDLDFLAFDRYRLVRVTDESDADFRARIYGWVDNLARATPAALKYYAEGVEGVAAAAVSEDLTAGITTIEIVIVDGAVSSTVIEAVKDGLSAVRAAGRFVNVELA